jgi:hypothetical protein
VVVHLLLALTLRWWSLQAAIAQSSAGSSVPIELIDLAPETATLDTPASSSAATPAQDPSSAEPTQASDEASDLEPGVTAVISESLGASAPSPVIPSPSPSPQPLQPSPVIPQALPFTPPAFPSSEPSPETSPETVQNNGEVPPVDTNNQAPVPSDNSVTPTEPNNLPEQPPGDAGTSPAESEQTDPRGGEDPSANPDNGTGESEAETASNSAPPAPTVPDSSSAPANGDVGEPIGQVAVSQNSVPAEFQASLSVSAPTGVGDIPDGLAEPKVTSQAFFSDAASGSGCPLDPESVRYFGQSVELRIAIDEQGRVLSDATVVRQPSSSEAFDQLAKCAIASWEFTPAFDRINNVDSAVFSNLDVRVTINSIN